MIFNLGIRRLLGMTHKRANDQINLDDIAAEAERLTIVAAKEILALRDQGPEALGISMKENDTVLTIADGMAQDIIIDGLSKQFPNIPIVSEEFKESEIPNLNETEYFFLVDPLDGTKHYANGKKFAINIALVKRNLDGTTTPVVGVINTPVTDIMYTGINYDDGSSTVRVKNTVTGDVFEPDAFDQSQPPQDFILASSNRSMISPVTTAFLDNLKAKKGVEPSAIVSDGHGSKAMMIVDGDADMYLQGAQLSEWDVAAPHAILKALGGSFIDMNTGAEMQYGNNAPHFGVESVAGIRSFTTSPFDNAPEAPTRTPCA